MVQRPRELGDFKKARVNGGTDNDKIKSKYFVNKFTTIHNKSKQFQLMSLKRIRAQCVMM